MVDSQKLRELLASNEESPRVEFKLKYELSGPSSGTTQDECAKDILALANTAGRSADDYAYLIIGAGDVLGAAGVRAAADMRSANFSGERFLQIVNARCQPPLGDLRYAEIESNGNYYGVIEIPPSALIHGLSRNLDTPKCIWHQGSVLLRRGSNIGAASLEELKLMEREKQSWLGSGSSSSSPTALSPVAQLEEWLPDPHKKILIDKLVMSEAKKLRAALDDPDFLNKDSAQNVEALIKRISEYDRLTAEFLKLFVTGCFHGEDWLGSSLWSDALTIIGQVKEEGHSADRLLRLRRYPALLLLYAGGVAAVAGRRYKILAALLNQTKVHRWNKSHLPFEQLVAGTVVEHYDQKYLERQWDHRMPLEWHLQNQIRDLTGEIFHAEDEFLDCFTKFEYLFTLNGIFGGQGIIRGSYMWESELRRKFQQHQDHKTLPVIRETDAEVARNRLNWQPFKQGVFNSGLFYGDWDAFNQRKVKADQEIFQYARKFITHEL